MLRVLHMEKSILFGGIARVVLDLAHAQANSGDAPVVLTHPDRPLCRILQSQGIDPIEWDLDAPPLTNVRTSVRYWRALAQAIQSVSPDILHVHGAHLLNECYLLPFLTRLPLVVHVQGSFLATQANLRTRWALRQASAVVCVSKYVSESVHRVAPGLHTVVVYNAVDVEGFRPARTPQEIRASLGLGDGVFVVGLVAHFVQRCKRHETFVRAAGRLRNDAGIEFIVVGGKGPDSSYFLEVTDLSARLGVEGKVRFVGDQRDVASYMAAMDAVVSCTEGEACGLNLLEAMALGKPIIATRSGGIPEVVEEGRTGLLYGLDDDEALAAHIRHMAQDRRVARLMGEVGRERVRKLFSVQAQARAVTAMYSEVLESANDGAARRTARVLGSLIRAAWH